MKDEIVLAGIFLAAIVAVLAFRPKTNLPEAEEPNYPVPAFLNYNLPPTRDLVTAIPIVSAMVPGTAFMDTGCGC